MNWERANLTEKSSTSTIVKDFDTAVVLIEAHPVKVFADQLLQEFAASEVVRHKAVEFRNPASRV